MTGSLDRALRCTATSLPFGIRLPATSGLEERPLAGYSILGRKQSAREGNGLKRWLRIAGGLGMVLVGLVLVVLPIVPGWWLVIPGLILLGREFHWARRLLAWVQSRLPQKPA